MTDAARPRWARWARWRWAGAGASVALAAASWGAGSRPELNRAVLWPGVAWWLPTGGSPLLTTVSVLAMGLLVLAWWRLRRAEVTVAWWWRTAALWFGPLVASVPLYSRDLYSYAAQGMLWLEGLDPYEHGVRELASDWRGSTAPTWLDTPSPYGPVWLLLARGVAAVSGGHLWVALLLLRLLAVAGLVVVAWGVPDVARRLGVDPVRAVWLGVACPLVGAHFVGGAHNDALMVGAVVAGLALALRRRAALACVVVALGAMVKVTAVVALPFVALLWALSASPARPLAWSRVVRCGLLTVVCAAVPMALVTVASRLGGAWLNPAATPGKNEQWTSLPTSLGIATEAVGHVLGRPDWRAPAVAGFRAAGLAVLAVLLVVIWLGAARGPAAARGAAAEDARARERHVVRGCGWALLAVVVLAPVFLGWYYLWVLPVLAASLGPEWRRAETPLAVVASVLCFSTLPEGFSLGLRTTAVGVPFALVAAVLLVRHGLRTARRLDARRPLDLTTPLVRPAAAPRD